MGDHGAFCFCCLDRKDKKEHNLLSAPHFVNFFANKNKKVFSCYNFSCRNGGNQVLIPSIAQYRKDSRRVTMSDLVDHSFGVFLVVFNLCLVSTIYGAYDILYVRQIFAIVISAYLSLRLYQYYRTQTDGVRYRFLKNNLLGKIFTALFVLGMTLAIIADLMMVSHY